MTEEIKQENKWAISKEYRQFLLTILASFLGCLVALCLYNASLRPQPPVIHVDCPCAMHNMHRPDFPMFDEHRGPRPDFKKHAGEHHPRPQIKKETKK